MTGLALGLVFASLLFVNRIEPERKIAAVPIARAPEVPRGQPNPPNENGLKIEPFQSPDGTDEKSWEELPEGWERREFNGRDFYLVPLSVHGNS